MNHKKLSSYFTKKPSFLKPKEIISQDIQEYILDYIPLEEILEMKSYGKSRFSYSDEDLNLRYLLKRKQEKDTKMKQVYDEVMDAFNVVMKEYNQFFENYFMSIDPSRTEQWLEQFPWYYWYIYNFPNVTSYFTLYRKNPVTLNSIQQWLQNSSNPFIIQHTDLTNVEQVYKSQHQNLIEIKKNKIKNKELKLMGKPPLENYENYFQYILWIKFKYFHIYVFTFLDDFLIEVVPLESSDPILLNKDIETIYNQIKNKILSNPKIINKYFEIKK